MAFNLYKMNISSATHHLGDVRRFVEAHAAAAGFSDEVVEQFKLAVDEACTNVIKHAYKGKESGRIEIAISVNSDQFVVTIRDQGRAFDPSVYHSPDIYHSIKKRRPGGYGVHLMKSLMDRVEYRTEGNVNEVQLTKYRNQNGASKS